MSNEQEKNHCNKQAQKILCKNYKIQTSRQINASPRSKNRTSRSTQITTVGQKQTSSTQFKADKGQQKSVERSTPKPKSKQEAANCKAALTEDSLKSEPQSKPQITKNSSLKTSFNLQGTERLESLPTSEQVKILNDISPIHLRTFHHLKICTTMVSNLGLSKQSTCDQLKLKFRLMHHKL